jgi:hypothetical protein
MGRDPNPHDSACHDCGVGADFHPHRDTKIRLSAADRARVRAPMARSSQISVTVEKLAVPIDLFSASLGVILLMSASCAPAI